MKTLWGPIQNIFWLRFDFEVHALGTEKETFIIIIGLISERHASAPSTIIHNALLTISPVTMITFCYGIW